MFIGDSKFIRVCVIIAFSIVCLVLTLAFVLPYFTSQNKPPLRAVLFVLLFDIISIVGFIHYFVLKRK